MSEKEEKISLLKTQLLRIDNNIRGLLSKKNKDDESFKQDITKYNNVLPLLKKEVKEKDFELNKYIKAIEIKKTPSKSQVKESKKHEDLEKLLIEKIHKSKILLKESEKESEEVLNLKTIFKNLESENVNLKKIIKDNNKSDEKDNKKKNSSKGNDDAEHMIPVSAESKKESYKNLVNEAIKVCSGYYEGNEVNQAMKFYIKIIEGDSIAKTQAINKELVDDVILKLKKYEIEYDHKIADLIEHESDLLLKNQQLKTEGQKNKSEIDSANAQLNSNSGEFVGGSDFFVSFCDVQSVLLCFFVVFFSISNQDYEKFEVFFSTWNDKAVELNRPYNISLNEQELKVIGKVKELVSSGVDPETITRNDADKIEFIFPSANLFMAGDVKVSSKGLNDLNSKFKELILLGGIKQIRIQSYTDDKELKKSQKLSQKYYNNFTLSVARSSSIAAVFNQQYRFPEKSTVITGYDSRKDPESKMRSKNNTIANRIEIEIIRDKNIKKKFS